MKKLIAIVLILCVFSVPVLAASQASKNERYATGNILYFKSDFFFGLKAASDRNPDGYLLNSEDFKKLIKRVPSAQKEYQEYESNAMIGMIVMIAGGLAGAGLILLSVDYTNFDFNYPLLIGGVVVAMGAEIAGYIFYNNAVNHFYQSVHQYNKAMIRAGFRRSF